MDYILNILLETLKVLTEMAPYLLFGFFVAGLLTMFLKPEMVEKHLGKNDTLSVTKASLFGIPLPLCSCGVIPVAASLKQQGASKGATTSFLISTPQTGIDSLIVTYGVLGPVITIFKPIAAFISAIIGGVLINIFDKDEAPQNIEPPKDNTPPTIKEPLLKRIKQALHHGFVTIPNDINISLIVGLLIAGFISASVPDNFFADIFGSGIVAMIVILVFSIPLYVCSTGSVPIAASLIMKGFSPGAALVLLIAGPATNAATITTMWKVLGKKSCIIYLLTMAITAIGAGLILDLVIINTEITKHLSHTEWMLPGIINNLCAIVLVLLLIYGANESKIKRTFVQNNTSSEQVNLIIEGMNCQHCVNSIEKALQTQDNINNVFIDLKTGTAAIYGKNLQEDTIIKIINNTGFSAKVNSNSKSCCSQKD